METWFFTFSFFHVNLNSWKKNWYKEVLPPLKNIRELNIFLWSVVPFRNRLASTAYFTKVSSVFSEASFFKSLLNFRWIFTTRKKISQNSANCFFIRFCGLHIFHESGIKTEGGLSAYPSLDRASLFKESLVFSS